MRGKAQSFVVAFMFCWLIPGWLSAQSQESLDAMASHISENARVVVRMDLTQVSPANLKAALDQVFPQLTSPIGEVTANLTPIHQSLTAAGATDLYAVIRMEDLPNGSPYLIMPVSSAAEGDKLAAVVQQSLLMFAQRHGNVVIAARDGAAYTPPAGGNSGSRFVEAFADVKGAPLQFIAIPTNDDRRVVRELYPRFPEALGGGTTDFLSQGLERIACQLTLKPQIRGQVVIGMKQGPMTLQCSEFIEDGLKRLAKHPDMAKHVPQFGELASRLNVDVSDRQIRLALTLNDEFVQKLTGALARPLQEARDSAYRSQGMNQLKQLALAMHNYYDVYKHLPPYGSHSKEGKPLLSWRVHILPFIEHLELYQQFHLDEPWDSEHNKKLIPLMPQVYLTPNSKLPRELGRTTYHLPWSESTAFKSREGAKFREILDGTSNTLMVIESDDERAMIWTKPEPFKIDPTNPGRGLGGHFEGGFITAFCDGSVHFLKNAISPKTLNALISSAGGEVVQPDEL